MGSKHCDRRCPTYGHDLLDESWGKESNRGPQYYEQRTQWATNDQSRARWPLSSDKHPPALGQQPSGFTRIHWAIGSSYYPLWGHGETVWGKLLACLHKAVEHLASQLEDKRIPLSHQDEGGLDKGTSLQTIDEKSAGQLDWPEIQSSFSFGIARRS